MIPIFLALLCASASRPPLPLNTPEPPPYTTLWFEQPVDHMNRDAGTFKVKVLLQTTNADDDSPLFVYTGNEAPIEDFYQITGFLTGTLQEQFNAKVAFIEHRYFGESFPSVGLEYQYLNTEQVLWDFADITMQLKPKMTTPVIAIGGSYGGMLSAMFRLKYPHVVDGALASSAPLLAQYQDGEAFIRIVSSVYEKVSSECGRLIQKGFNALRVLSRESRLYNTVSDAMNICKPMKTNYEFLQLAEYVKAGFTFMAEYNYPYPVDVLGAVLPASPIEAACEPLEEYAKTGSVNTWDLLSAMMKGAGVYYNATKTEECYKIDDYEVFQTGSWPYQKCNELLFPLGSNGVDDIFNYNPWNITTWNADCQKAYGTQTRPKQEDINYGLYKNIQEELKYASNIIFSNGEKDPWSYGGIMTQLNQDLATILIADSSHHMDLRSPNPADPSSVVDARAQEISIIKYWIAQKESS